MSFFHEKTNAGTTRREPPRGYVTLIICLADPIAVSSLDAAGSPLTAFAAGAASGALKAVCGANNTGIEVQLRPWFAQCLLGQGVVGARAGITDVTHLLPSDLDRSGGGSISGLNDQIELVTDWLLRRAATGSDDPRPEIIQAWHLLEASAGALSITDLAARTGCSHRYFKEIFEAAAGLKPKRAARLLRLGRAIELIETADKPPLSEIAYACGFSDQSHLTREFQHLAAISPAVLGARRLTEMQGFGEEAV